MTHFVSLWLQQFISRRLNYPEMRILVATGAVCVIKNCMGDLSTDDSRQIEALLRAAAGGDAESWRLLVGRFEERLRRMVLFRLNARVYGRIDESDVIQ